MNAGRGAGPAAGSWAARAAPVCGGFFFMTHVGPSAAAAGPPYSRLSTEDDLL
jgi:hypothetical protein